MHTNSPHARLSADIARWANEVGLPLPEEADLSMWHKLLLGAEIGYGILAFDVQQVLAQPSNSAADDECDFGAKLAGLD